MPIGTSSPVACLFIPLTSMDTQKFHSPLQRQDDLTSCHVLCFPTEAEFFSSELRVRHSTLGYGFGPDGPRTGA